MRFINVLGFFLVLSCIHSCDLNHDWRLFDTKLERDIDARTILNNLIPRLDPQKKYMVLEVRDLYQRKGQEKLIFIDDHFQKFNGNSQIRNEEEVSQLQNKLMDMVSKQVLYLPLQDQLANKDRLYDQDFLAELKKKYDLDAFISIKLRNYAIVSKKYQDKYEYNQFVFKDTQEHVIEMTYAILNSEGRYLEFKDWKGIITLESIFEQKEDSEKLLIVNKFFNIDEGGYTVEEHFLGLEAIKDFGQTMVGLLEL
ncbi:hypothetical protein MJH12_01490 [bacterium]|nr:hypothetical protein [bacterium]